MKNQSISIWTILLSLSAFSFSQTTIPGGNVSGTWDQDHSPYLVTDNITVPDGSALIIEPGVRVEFQGHYSLNVQGRLLAEGTETDSILFTVSDTTGFSNPDTSMGGWYGIRFLDTPVANDSSRIAYCCFEYGKAFGSVWHLNAGGAICILQFGKVVISKCLFRHNKAVSSSEHSPIGGAVYLFESDVIIRENRFINNQARDGGAIYFDSSDPLFMNNIIENNKAFNGGGIAMGGECHPLFSNDSILNNTAENNGGGLLFFEPSIVHCEGVVVSGNRARWGGGIGIQGGTLFADDCRISGNRAEVWGGGVAGDYAMLELDSCIFVNDTSDWGSGGLHMDHATASITHCSFIENRAIIGGAFHALFSQVTSGHNEFLSNTADSGGGVHLENSDCSIDQSHFEGNQAINGTGGAVDYSANTSIFGRSNLFTLSRSRLIGNMAAQHSAAARIEQLESDTSLVDVVVDSCQFTGNHSDVYGSLRIGGFLDDFTVSRSIFQGNTSDRYVGGAGFISNSSGTVSNCLFNSNYSQYSDTSKTAHGASLGSGAEVIFLNCTFTDTSAAEGVGLSVRRGSKADLVNTVFWGSGIHPVNVTTAAGLGSTVSINYCDIQFGSDSIGVSDSLSILDWGVGNISEDPQFVDQMNGDLHLMDSSPCIGSGVNSILLSDVLVAAPERDLEGNPRPVPEGSDVDMGAYENMLASPVQTALNHLDDPGATLLLQNYPNPFSHNTTFAYALPVTCSVRLSVCNLFGQEVAVLVSEKQQAGVYRLDWESGRLDAGQYLCVLYMDGRPAGVRKMVILR